MSNMNNYIIAQAEKNNQTVEEFMDEHSLILPEEDDDEAEEENEDDFDLPKDWEPDYTGGLDTKELQIIWKSLK